MQRCHCVKREPHFSFKTGLQSELSPSQLKVSSQLGPIFVSLIISSFHRDPLALFFRSMNWFFQSNEPAEGDTPDLCQGLCTLFPRRLYCKTSRDGRFELCRMFAFLFSRSQVVCRTESQRRNPEVPHFRFVGAKIKSCNGNVWFVVVLSIAVPLCHCNQLIASSRNLLAPAFFCSFKFPVLWLVRRPNNVALTFLNHRFFRNSFFF